MSVLITFIGKGTRKKDGSNGYEKAEYRIGDNNVKTSCFANAIVSSGVYNFSRIIVIGTYSSSWGELINSEKDVDFFCDFEDKLEKTRNEKETLVTPELLEELKHYLVDEWKISNIELIAHPATPLYGNLDEIANKYFNAVNGIEDDILLDVTHSMRWMPLLMQPIIEESKALNNNGDVNIIYGDITCKDPAGIPLIGCTEAAKHAKDISAFFGKWDAGPLYDSLEDNNLKPLARAIRKLANHLGGNFMIPLVIYPVPDKSPTPIECVKKAVDNIQMDSVPSWIKELCAKLNDFCRMFEGKSPSRRLWILARLYADRKLFAQALLCQEICLSIFAWEKNGSDRRKLKYDDLKTIKDNFINCFSGKTNSELRNISYVRNAIAHGAADTEYVDNVTKLDEIFINQQTLLERIMQG